MNPFLWLVWAVLLLVVLFVASAVGAAIFEGVRRPGCSSCKKRDSSSDPRLRVVLLCSDRNEGRDWAEKHKYPLDALVMVTPGSRNACRGRSAEAVYATPRVRSHPRFYDLVDVAAPCVVTRPSEDRVC